MTSFKPTWLYIKQHQITKLLYFGKTVSNPDKYPGSGKVWTRHLKIHGKFITTIWCKQFTNQTEMVEFALAFSEIFDIVNSSEWANLIAENGIDGAPAGRKLPSEVKQKIKNSMRNLSDYTHLKGVPKSEEWKLHHSSNMKDKPQMRCCCLSCFKEVTANSLIRHANGKHCTTN